MFKKNIILGFGAGIFASIIFIFLLAVNYNVNVIAKSPTATFTEPTTAPPYTDLYAPINTGPENQTKSGGLILGADLNVTGNITGTQLCIGSDCRGSWPTGGSSGGGLSGNGSTNYMPLWTGVSSLGNSIISQSGSVLTVNGSLRVTAGTIVGADLNVTGNIKGNQLCIGSDCRGSWPTGGSSGGGLSGSGSTNYVPLWTGASSLGNSIISQSGSVLTVIGDIKGTRLCIGTDCKNSWPTGGGLSGGSPGAMPVWTDASSLGNSLISQSGSQVTVNGSMIVNGPTGNLTVGGVISGNRVTGTQLCIGADCKSSWPTGGGLSGSGSTNYVPLWTGASSLGNSIISQSGSVLTVIGDIKGTRLCIGTDCKNSWPSGLSGGSSGAMPVWTGASSLGNSIIFQSGSVLTVNGSIRATAGTVVHKCPYWDYRGFTVGNNNVPCASRCVGQFTDRSTCHYWENITKNYVTYSCGGEWVATCPEVGRLIGN